GATDHPQPLRVLERVARDACRAPHDHGVARLDCARELLALQSAGLDDLETVVARQWCETLGRHVVSDQDTITRHWSGRHLREMTTAGRRRSAHRRPAAQRVTS